MLFFCQSHSAGSLVYEPIITDFFDNEEEMVKFQKWREEYEEKERLEKEEKAKQKEGAD